MSASRRYLTVFLLSWLSCVGLSTHTFQWSQGETSSSSSSNGRTTVPHRPSSKVSHTFSGSSVSEAGREKTGSLCGVKQLHHATIPAGQTSVDRIEPLNINDIYQCAHECCKYPSLYQYAWIITEKCFCVGCDDVNATRCEPRSLEGLMKSTYASLTFPPTMADTPIVTTATPIITTATPTITTANSRELSTSPPPTEAPPTTVGTTAPSSQSPLPTTAMPHSPSSSPEAQNTHIEHNDIQIVFAGDLDITLPRNHTRISSSTSPLPRQEQTFLYQWEKVSGPSQGSLVGINTDQLELTGLVAGVYELKLTVRNGMGEGSGEALVNVTVHTPVRTNKDPPTALISTPHANVVLPIDSLLLDASASHDALGSDQLTFHWEEMEGPVDSSLTSDSKLLKLTNLKQGVYKFRLTVTDAEGLSATADATVTVEPEPYYPPQALPGEDQLIKLPNNHITLDGSKSKSFKGELQYMWEMLKGPSSVDMKGTNTASLELLNFSSTGDYIFRLTVMDSTGKKSSANVSVVVIAENNLPPVADAGPDQTVKFPDTSAQLSGNSSTDDFRIDQWLWTQLRGPHDIILSGDNTSLLQVERLHVDAGVGSPTLYQFQLTVWDYLNLTNTSTVTITYRKDPKIPPHVDAGGDVSITLPQSTVVLNASRSYDDFGIASYEWVRSESSPAAGLVVNGSDHGPVLVLSDLVQGTYNYSLTVTNSQGMMADDMVQVTVLPNPQDMYLLQVYLDTDPTTFTLTDQVKLERVLQLILDDISVDYDIIIEQVEPFGPHVRVEFYATRHDTHTPINATLAYAKLTERGQDYYYSNSNFHFVKINMKVCQLACSGRGECDTRTHRCKCSRFWMENPIKAYFGKRETNCEWSIFYVALAVILCVAALLFLVWLACCCCLRKRRIARTKRRVRYAILDRKEMDEGREMLPRDYQHTSLMVSESETEEELIFDSTKNKFGSKNGDALAPSEVQIRTSNQRVPNGKMSTSSDQHSNT